MTSLGIFQNKSNKQEFWNVLKLLIITYLCVKGSKMSKAERRTESRAKRNLELSSSGDETEAKNAKRSTVNTAVEITEYATRQRNAKSGKSLKAGENLPDKGKKKEKQTKEKFQGSFEHPDPLEVVELRPKRKSGNTPGKSKAKTKPSEKSNKTGQSCTKLLNTTTAVDSEINFAVRQGDGINQTECDTDCDEEGVAPVNSDGITLRVDADEDEFIDSDSDDSVKIKTPARNDGSEEIPLEVIERLKEHPMMQEFVNEVVSNRIRKYESNSNFHRSEIANAGAAVAKRNGKESAKELGKMTKTLQRDFVKSPSDTTIYRPALMKGVNESNDIINRISNFVEDIRISNTRQNTPDDGRRGHMISCDGRTDEVANGRERGPSTSRRRNVDDGETPSTSDDRHRK